MTHQDFLEVLRTKRAVIYLRRNSDSLRREFVTPTTLAERFPLLISTDSTEYWVKAHPVFFLYFSLEENGRRIRYFFPWDAYRGRGEKHILCIKIFGKEDEYFQMLEEMS